MEKFYGENDEPLYDRTVWIAGHDSDEFAIDIAQYRCFTDILQNYTNYPGLNIPWTFFGHSQYFLSPSPLYKLVTETYTEREPSNQPDNNGKVFNRLNRIINWKTGHTADFWREFAINEFYENNLNYDFVNPPVPTFRLHHYFTKSVEHLLKKWLRGLPMVDGNRPVNEIFEYIEGFATKWTTKVRSENLFEIAYWLI